MPVIKAAQSGKASGKACFKVGSSPPTPQGVTDSLPHTVALPQPRRRTTSAPEVGALGGRGSLTLPIYARQELTKCAFCSILKSSRKEWRQGLPLPRPQGRPCLRRPSRAVRLRSPLSRSAQRAELGAGGLCHRSLRFASPARHRFSKRNKTSILLNFLCRCARHRLREGYRVRVWCCRRLVRVSCSLFGSDLSSFRLYHI